MAENGFMQVGQVGPHARGDGTIGPVRLGAHGDQVVNAWGKFFEAAQRGFLFHGSLAVAGVAPGTALSTAPMMCLWNPPSSGVDLAIQQTWVSYVSGTLGAGSMVHAYVLDQPALPTTGTQLEGICARLSGARPKGRIMTGSTVGATTLILRPSLHLGAALATTATFPFAAYDEVEGSIVIPPGSAWAYQGVAAAGSTPLILAGVLWAEVPIV